MIRFVYLIFFILTASLVCAAVPAKKAVIKHTKAVLHVDSASSVQVRHFDQASLEKYRRLPEFKYKEKKVDTSWWNRFWAAFWDWVRHLFSFKPSGKALSIWAYFWKFIEILIIVAAAAGIILAILKAAGLDVRNILHRRSSATAVPYSEFFEDINAIDFDSEIENAVTKHNYRFAVRLLYLKCLKQLSDSGFIEWKIDKTNYAYINELKDINQKETFSQLTRQFEYVWYGQFMIDGNVYNTISQSFQDFNKRAA